MSNLERLISKYPKLYHMAEFGSWPKIEERGLLSTTALLDAFEIVGEQRFKIESGWRPTSVAIEHPHHGEAIIRDQKPMTPHTLGNVLIDDVTPQQWYEFLNRKTFFWVTLDRLTRLLSAGAYRTRSHDVLVVDTQGLVERHFDRITLSPINSGVSAFGPKYPRNLDTFQGIEAYPLTEKLQSIGLDGLVELVVDYSVPDIADFVLAVEEWHGKQKQGVIWER